MHMEKITPPSSSPRVAALLRTVALFKRDDIENAVDSLIALLDARDGDPDMEDDERGSTILMRAGRSLFEDELPHPPLDGLPGDPDDAEDDDEDTAIEDQPHDREEDFGEEEQGERASWAEQIDQRHPIAVNDDESEEDLADLRARKPHRDRIRRTRCVATRDPFTPWRINGRTPAVALGA